MTPEQVRELLTGRKTPQANTDLPFAFIKTDEGELEKVYGVKTSEYGSFAGKAGSVRRSRKGRTYRAANGTRKYQFHLENVVAYKV